MTYDVNYESLPLDEAAYLAEWVKARKGQTQQPRSPQAEELLEVGYYGAGDVHCYPINIPDTLLPDWDRNHLSARVEVFRSVSADSVKVRAENEGIVIQPCTEPKPALWAAPICMARKTSDLPSHWLSLSYPQQWLCDREKGMSVRLQSEILSVYTHNVAREYEALTSGKVAAFDLRVSVLWRRAVVGAAFLGAVDFPTRGAELKYQAGLCVLDNRMLEEAARKAAKWPHTEALRLQEAIEALPGKLQIG